MAEIPIERKEGRNWLPWILGLIALLALGFCFLRDRDGTPAAARPADTAASVAGADTAASAAGAAAPTAGDANGAIDQFAQYVQARDTTQESEGNHQYTAEGTRRLAAALDAIAGGNPNIGVYADSMRSSIDRLQRSSDQDVHADDAKAAFSAAVSAMAQINQARNRTQDVAPMRAIYNELSSQRPLLPQLGTVHRFFQAASEALQQMRA